MPPGGYVHIEQLGGRSWTTLYRAVRVSDARPILLDVLNPQHCHEDLLALFARHLEIGKAIRSVSILAPLALCTFDGRPALELEHTRGHPLETWLGTALAIDAFLDLAIELTSALADLHQRGVVHGALQPRCILVDRGTGAIQLSGLWQAQRATLEGAVHRPALLIEGSLPYVSPEQTGRLNRSVDRRADLYSLGVIFFELLTGRLPFDAPDAIGWVYCHLARRPPVPNEIVRSVPAVLSSILLKLLEKAPEDRYQTAVGLLHDLRRCQATARSVSGIEPFPLGRADVSDAFTIPQKLYGRDRSRTVLLEAFERVASGSPPRLVLVSGSAGVGKSSLVYELQRPTLARGGRFSVGKFDQYKQEFPYAALVGALRELVLDILADSPAQVAEYRRRLTAAVGTSAPLVCGLIPQVSLILGPQPSGPDLPAAEIEKRLRVALHRLLSVFATTARPLVIFLDDLQWVDIASLEFLIDVVTDADLRHLLVVIAYRSSEVGPLHPLRRALDRVGTAGAPVDEIPVGPLSASDLGQLIADAAHVFYAAALPLARVVHDKTGGNPFFVVQFLLELHRRNLITYHPLLGRWHWDLAAVLAQPCSDNLTDLLVAKVRSLPADAQATLGIGAYLGRVFDVDTLKLVMPRDPGPALSAAVEHGLLVPFGRTYQFPHGRVQEAAYSLVPESERAATHLRIGQCLLVDTPPQKLHDRSFDLLVHLNRGGALLTTVAERERVANLNLVAGQRAQAWGAHASARAYFAAGSALLPGDIWERRYGLAFPLGIGQAECELALGALGAANERLADLAQRACGLLDQAAVARAQATLSVMETDFVRSIEVLLGFLRHVGIEWSLGPSDESIRDEYELLQSQLGAGPIEDLIELGAADASTQATMEVLFMLAGVATSTDDRIMRLAVCRMVNLSLERGHCDASPLAFIYLGQIVGPYFGDYHAGVRFARLGLELLEQRQQSRFRGRALIMAGGFVFPWTQPLEQALELLRRGFEAALEAGDTLFACLAMRTEVSIRLLSGTPLVEVEQVALRALEFTRKAKIGTLFQDLSITQMQLIRTLRGLTPNFPSFDETGFDECGFEARFASDPNLVLAEGWYWIRKLEARHYGGDYSAAKAAAVRADALAWTTEFALERLELQLYGALTIAAHFDSAAPDDCSRQRAKMAEKARALQARARDCPANFGACAALVAAELARIDGDHEGAAQGYEQAIRLARERNFVWMVALGYETAAAFYRARGFGLIAATYLQEARRGYQSWGADGKVRQLERRHPSLAHGGVEESARLAVRPEQLDLLAVIKASQTISGAILQDQLLKTLLHVVLEQGGARRARLVLLGHPNDEGEVVVAAEASIDDASPSLGPAPRVPTSMIEYVRRTGSLVLLDDAMADAGRFANDPYLARESPRSVLCLPVRRQGALAGILYLDNDLAPGVFTADRLLALELLATQAAVSLQNADLLARERAAREEAELDRRRALLLGEVTALLSEASNPETLSLVVRLACTYGFADWAMLDVAGRGGLQRVASAHRDAAKGPLLHELTQRYPDCFGAALLAMRVRDASTPLHLVSISNEQRRSLCTDDEHAARAQELGLRTLLIVPLVARGVQLGALSLMAGKPCHFQPGDVALGVELGRRLGMAVDSARLAELESLLHQSQKMEAIGRLAGGVAHDFNNMLCVILTYSETAQQRLSPDDPLREDVDEILKAGERATNLTRQLLAFSRHRLVEPQVVDLNSIVVGVKNMLTTLLGAHIAFTFRPSDALWKTRADPGQLEQVLMNLTANARDAMAQGGRLLIETANVELDEQNVCGHLGVAPGEYVLLAVTDTGCGMARELQAHIFEPFFTTKKRGQGTGLGLATVFGIVRQSGGHVAVDSEVGRGTTLRIYLPRCAAPADTAAAGDVISESAPSALASLHGSETILLVEDDEQVRGAARTILQGHGHTVLEASGPGEALLICEQYPEAIDVLLSDVVMPRLNGPELARRVIVARPGIRLVFMSGYTETPPLQLAMGEYVAEFLQKPFTPETLAQKIRKVLSLESANGTHDSG